MLTPPLAKVRMPVEEKSWAAKEVSRQIVIADKNIRVMARFV